MKVFTYFVSFLTLSSCFRDGNKSRIDGNLTESFSRRSVFGLSEIENDKLFHLRRNLVNPEDFSMLVRTANVSIACQRGLQEYLDSLIRFEAWALEVYDSSSKISSGMLSGNINNFGDFDECLHAKSPSTGTRGKYCLAYVNIDVPADMEQLLSLKKISHSMETFKSGGFDDLYHYIPIFSSFFWASCVPSSCHHEDVRRLVRSQFNNVFNGTGVEIEIKADEKLCQVQSSDDDATAEENSTMALLFLAAIVGVITITTLYDLMMIETELGTKHALTSFSLVRNWKELVSLDDRGPDDIKSVHGIRFIAVLMIFISHKSFFVYFYPMANRTKIIAETFTGSTVPIRAGFLYTDLFLMISGLLASFSLFRKLERYKSINILEEYFDRYLRMMPSMAVLILFSTNVLQRIGSGPLYKILTDREAELCRDYWWRNLLFINVWWGVKPMCAFHTQHVAIDFELFLVAPLLAVMIYKRPKRGLQLLLLAALVSSLAKCYVAYQNKLSEFIIHGLTSRQLMETADFMYILPPYRFTSYAIGIASGYFLRKARDVKISSTQIYFIWTVIGSALFLSLRMTVEMSEENYTYDPLHAALITFLPIPFCAFFALVIFTAELKFSNIFTNFLEWKGFKVTTRLSYNFYLVQFTVFYYNTGTARGAAFYNLVKTGIDFNELIFIMLGTLVLTLCVEMPVKNLRNAMFQDKFKTKKLQ